MEDGPKILVIRGGALGDFILTLPAIRLLRETFDRAKLEILGYTRTAVLADGRFYADRIRSIDYGPMAGFFAKNGTLDAGLSEYFSGFQQVVSYLFDPDGIFEANLKRAGVRNYLSAYRRPETRHAAREWAQPLESLALFLEDPAPRLFLSEADHAGAREWLGKEGRIRLAVHPGSGSPRKNWAPQSWAELGELFWASHPEGELVLVGGEADGAALKHLASAWQGRRFRLATGLDLPTLAAVIAACGTFAGHDSGVSHLAAAAGASCTVLFGPTDPAVWAPLNLGVQVLVAPHADWRLLSPETVWGALRHLIQS